MHAFVISRQRGKTAQRKEEHGSRTCMYWASPPYHVHDVMTRVLQVFDTLDEDGDGLVGGADLVRLLAEDIDATTWAPCLNSPTCSLTHAVVQARRGDSLRHLHANKADDLGTT